VAPPEAFAMPVQSPPCIIKWDNRVARAEEDLVHAVIVTICGTEPLAPASEVAEVLAARLGVEAGSLVLRQASSSSYLRSARLHSPSCASGGVGWLVLLGGCCHACSTLSFGEFRLMFGKPQLWSSS
jgi:hypothetical protein